MDNFARIQEILNDLSLDGVLISNENNIRYISGFTGATGYIYISKKTKKIITDFRYTTQAELETYGYEIITIGNSGYEASINNIIKKENINRLGFESEDLLYSSFLSLKSKLDVEELVPIKDEITRLRRIKTTKELENIKMAEAIGDKTFTDILSYIQPGMTEIQIAARIEYLLKINGGQGLSFPAIVASGTNSSMPHAIPGNKKLANGDFLTLDFGCIYNGYCSDMTRTIVIGRASQKQKEIYDIVLEAQLAALDFIKAGVKGKDVDKVARDIINKAGYEGCFGHGLGHSVGLFIHESPRLSMMEEDVLEIGMIETVEPGIYIKGFGGVRIEDLIVITENGHDNYTYSPKELIEL
ncbi:MAG TPA: aminopeptidase P family protein [Clostridiales bacterium]|nr:aminopeptidase P family protein [Clostridiales bacterium]